MAEWAIPMMIAGTVASAGQQYQQGKEQRKLYKQRAGVALADAAAVAKATKFEAREKRKEGKRFKARQKALFAKSGVRIAETALLVMGETEAEFERDAAFITEGGLVKEQRLRSQAGFERKMGKSAFRAGRLGAGATLLTGAGRIGTVGIERGWWNRTPQSRKRRTTFRQNYF